MNPRKSDRTGLTADLRHAIVVFTSNLGGGAGSEDMGIRLDRETPVDRERYLRSVREFFSPEFVGRLDAVVAFEPSPGKTWRNCFAGTWRGLREPAV